MTLLLTSPLGEGLYGYGVLLAIALLAHEPWRWLGLILGRTVTVDSAVFLWVRAVSTALVAGLIMRLILFPAGALADVALRDRLSATAVGVALFFAFGRSLGLGVGGGALALLGLIVFHKTTP